MNDGGGAKLRDFARPVGLPLGQDSNAACKHRECRSKGGTTKNMYFFFVFLRTLSEQLEQTLDVSCAAKYE